MRSCVCCQIETNKYKCPGCLQPFCSVVCYKTHKNEACIVKEEVPIMDGEVLEEPTLFDPFSTEDTVPSESLEQLKHSQGLRNLLCNPHLRNLLREIDVAPGAWKAIRAAMQEPLFVEFADECLKVLQPISEEKI